MKKTIFLTLTLCLCRLAHSQNISIEGDISIETNATLAVEGNFTHSSGTINLAGTIKFQGSAAKNFNANNQNLAGYIDFNGGTTTLTGKLRLKGGSDHGTIKITGNGVLNTGNKLTLHADTTEQVGRIDSITSTATTPLVSSADSMILITTRGYNSFRFFGNPFITQLPLTQFSDDNLEIDITGPGGTSSGFSVNTANNYAGAYKYSESLNKWVAYTKGTDSIKVGYGASIYVQNRKDQTLGSTGATYCESAHITLVGGLRSGNITTNLENTGVGWNLVANPYPSNIDILNYKVTWNNVHSSVHMYDKKNKSFVAYNRTNKTSTGKLANVIPMGASFLVQAAGASGTAASISFSESMKVDAVASKATGNPFFLTIDSLKNRFGVTIRNENVNSKNEEDQCVLLFANDIKSTDNYDSEYDAIDLKSEVVNIGVFSKNNTKLSISSYPNKLESYIETKFPLTVWSKDTGNYSIFYTNIAALDSNMEIWLKDNYLNKIQKIDQQSYTFKITNNPETMGDKRFELFPLKIEVSGTDKLHKNSIRFLPNPVNDHADLMVLFPENVMGSANAQIFDLTGKLVFQNGFDLLGGKSNSLILKTDKLSPNIYVVMVSTNQGVFSNKLIVTQ